MTRDRKRQAEQTETGPASEPAREAGDQGSGLGREFLEFVRDNKKWVLIPIMLVLLILGLLVLISSVEASFIYSFF